MTAADIVGRPWPKTPWPPRDAVAADVVEPPARRYRLRCDSCEAESGPLSCVGVVQWVAVHEATAVACGACK